MIASAITYIEDGSYGKANDTLINTLVEMGEE